MCYIKIFHSLHFKTTALKGSQSGLTPGQGLTDLFLANSSSGELDASHNASF